MRHKYNVKCLVRRLRGYYLYMKAECRREAISMRTLLIGTIVLLAAAVLLAAPLYAAETADTAKKVTIDADKTPVVDVIDAIFKGTGFSYTIEPGVSGTITASLTNVSFEDALKVVAESAGLKYELKDGRYIISPKESSSKQAKEAEPASKIDSGSSAEEAAKTNESAAVDENVAQNDQTPVDYNGPVAYGSLPPYGAYYDVGPIRNFILPPYEPYTITNGGDFSGVIHPLPPPGFRSVTLERMLAQMNALYNTPGYGAPTMRPLSRPNIFLTAPYYGF